MIRKVALVGTREGPWVSLQGMTRPHIRATIQPGTKLRIEHLNGQPEKKLLDLTVTRAGLHELSWGANFARVLVVEGEHESVLCDFICHT